MDCPPEESGRCGAEVTRQWRFDCTEIRATMRQLFCRKFRVNKWEPLIYWTTIANIYLHVRYIGGFKLGPVYMEVWDP